MAVLVCGVIGIAMYVAFLGFMLIWVPAPPLIIIVVVCTALLVYDFYLTLRYDDVSNR